MRLAAGGPSATSLGLLLQSPELFLFGGCNTTDRRTRTEAGGSDGEGEKGRSALARNGRNSNETTATEEEEEEGEDGAYSGATSRIRRRRVFKAAGGKKVLEERNNDNEWRHCWLAVLAVASLAPPSALSYETTARKAKKILSRGGGGG